MILHAALNTDIPQFYSDWILRRINDGFVDIREGNKINRYSFKKNKLSKIYFWSKDPQPLIKRFKDLKEIPYDFEIITELSLYDKCYEPKIKSKNRIMEDIRKSSILFGKDKVSFLYGPIFSTYNCTLQWHKDQFRFLCEQLHNSVNKVYISYDISSRCLKLQNYNIRRMTFDDQDELEESFEETAKKYGLELCFKPEISELKDSELDLSVMNACPSACIYCSGISNNRIVKTTHSKHHSYSSLLIGDVEYGAKINEIMMEKEEKVEKINTTSLFDF